MKKALYIILFVLCGNIVSAQHINKIITKDYVDHLIKILSDDKMEGRKTFSPGIEKAASFIEKEFKEIGLEPLDGAQNYRQTFYKYQLKPLSTKVVIDGEEIAEENILVYGHKTENLSFNQTNGDGWVKLDENKDFMSQFRTLARSGKRQLVLVDIKFLDAFKRIKGMLSRETVMDEDELGNTKNLAAVFVLDKDTVANGFDIELKNVMAKKPLTNIVGIIPGKTKTKEYVIFSAHYDHLGIVKPVQGDSIMNGADDNASGTSAVIALAKYYKKLNKNERTLIFTAFTGEEMGMLGSKYFSQQLNPEEVIAMLNIEMIGKESKFGKNAAFITGYERSNLGKILQKNLYGTEFTFHPDPYIEQNLFYRSDNATLAALGVPAHTISTDQIDIDKFYHTVKDEYQTLAVENILSTIKAIAKSAVSIINGTDTPSRIQKLNQ